MTRRAIERTRQRTAGDAFASHVRDSALAASMQGLPTVDITSLLPRTDYSALLPRMDVSALMPQPNPALVSLVQELSTLRRPVPAGEPTNDEHDADALGIGEEAGPENDGKHGDEVDR